ncbi:MAG: phenylacetate-CoA oxygenase subunit PaaJ [Gammaproteobacteria bacterium]|nr:phenylacetate-CoA oxygenase subunit PaaJ [Gammaproteobacteria bacterium]MDH3750445.1 phenylacetate-CoA oxygenase subunit PaaJ [Gammaproteobacteria bacterium]MDH3806372.1 phenylacetate-CoA oxygenase subunit PaaJ [Gammaproteobacteria bacterium]
MVAIGISREQVLDWLSVVPDPEIPVLTIADLGIVRGVTIDEQVIVELTPTYSGCPATEVIEQSVIDTLHKHGVDVSIKRVLSPPWTTDWISKEGRDKLKEYGIAPPEQGASKRELLQGNRNIACPRCDSVNTAVVSEFGSTACKASYKCIDCLEPFEYFKCI